MLNQLKEVGLTLNGDKCELWSSSETDWVEPSEEDCLNPQCRSTAEHQRGMITPWSGSICV